MNLISFLFISQNTLEKLNFDRFIGKCQNLHCKYTHLNIRRKLGQRTKSPVIL